MGAQNRTGGVRPAGRAARARRTWNLKSAGYFLPSAAPPRSHIGRKTPSARISTSTPSATPANYAFIGRRVVEGGPRRYNQRVNTYYGTVTLDGKFPWLAGDWYWDINGIYGRNKARQTVFGNVNAGNVALALGDPATELVKVAEEERVDLIAMSTHGHRFINDLLRGSTADRVRHRVTMPVLMVRSRGSSRMKQ